MQASDIHSVGHLNNQNGTVALTISLKDRVQPVFVSVSRNELVEAGGNDGLNANKQQAVNFFNKYGSCRNR